MNMFRKSQPGKNGGSSFEEGTRSGKPKNAAGFRLVQRKFAQGAPLPPTQPMAASPAPERRPEVPKEEHRMVYHNHMSATNLLDVIALQNRPVCPSPRTTFIKLYLKEIHPHVFPGEQYPQPTVRLERLRCDEMPGPSAPPLVSILRQDLADRRVLKTVRFKKRMCLRPRPGMALKPPSPRPTKTVFPRGIRPCMVRDVRLSTVSSTVSTTEDDLPLLYLRKEPTAEDVDTTDTESIMNFDFKRPLRPCTLKVKKPLRRRTREVTPMPWLLLQSNEPEPGLPRRSARRPCPRSLPASAQRPDKQGDYALLDSTGEEASDDGEEALSNFADRLHPICPASVYKSVQHVVRATTNNSTLLGRRCRVCDRCAVIRKIIKLSGLIQAAYRKRVSVNQSNFDATHPNQPFGHMRVTRPGHSRTWVFLDILPRSFPKGLKVEYKPLGDDKMDALVSFVDRWTMMDTSDISFMEQQNVIGNVLEYMETQVEGQGVLDNEKVRVEHSLEGLPGHQYEEPRPSTSRENVVMERKLEAKRKRIESDANQPSTSRANMGAERKPKRRRNEYSEARRLPRGKNVKASKRRPGPSGRNQVNKETETEDTDGATTEKPPEAEAGEKRVTKAPTFYPTKEEFRDPIAYFKSIEESASKYGVCKIVPPTSFKPPCKLLGNNRFSVVYQYITKLYNRWGPGSRELAAIKAYLWLQNFTIRRPPIMECSEINLPKLHHVVERFGGANNVVKNKRWARVAEEMNLRQVRNSERRLDQVFIQYLLPYASLSLDERQKKLSSVENGWTKKYQKIVKKAHNPFHKQERLLGEAVSSEEETELPEVVVALREAEDCIVPGRAMNLTVFKKVAETLRGNLFGRNIETLENIEEKYWRTVTIQGEDHIVANAASIDTGDEGYGFPKNGSDNVYSQHPYNLKMLAKQSDNVLRFLGDLLGANNPTLHLNMLFSTSCWHRDPHRLPWIEYMHKGEPKIWYGIPDSESENFRRAVQRLCPAFCQNKPIWLASDIAMIPPETLLTHNVKLTRLVQLPGEYILVLPKAHSSSIATGFSVSESVYFATLDWLESAPALFKGLRDCCEPSMFSLEQLLINGVTDPDTPRDLLLPMCSVLSTLISDELENRRLLVLKGLKIDEPLPPKRGPSRRGWNNAPECEFCRCTLFLSGVVGITGKRGAFCTEHALKLLDCGKYSHVEVPELEFRSNFKNVDLELIIKNMEARVVDSV